MRHAVVIANPIAGPTRGRLGGDQACALLAGIGIAAEFRPTRCSGHASDLARAAAAEGCDLVVALGGDGTVHEVAAGLTGTDTALGVLPSGSGNDFARAVGCFTIDQALAVLRDGRDRRLDTARLDEAFFVNSLGLLASGLVSNRAARLWRWLGRRRYVLASAFTLLSYSGQPVTWRLQRPDGREETRSGRYLLAELCNTKFTGGGFRFAPDADPTDGRLEAFLVDRIAPWAAMRQLPRAAQGHRLDHAAISVSPFTRLEFTVDRPVAYHRDGEAGYLPAGTHVVRIEPRSLRVRMPAQQTDRQDGPA